MWVISRERERERDRDGSKVRVRVRARVRARQDRTRGGQGGTYIPIKTHIHFRCCYPESILVCELQLMIMVMVEMMMVVVIVSAVVVRRIVIIPSSPVKAAVDRAFFIVAVSIMTGMVTGGERKRRGE